MSAALYTRDILRLATDVTYARPLTAPDAQVERRAILCGSRIVAEAIVDARGNVADYGYAVHACALGQASATVLARAIIGRSARDIVTAREVLAGYLSGLSNQIGDWPGIGAIAVVRDYPARHAAVLLPFDAAADVVVQAAAGRPE